MTNKPHVSVVIPTYRRGHLIDHVLHALQIQSYSDFEVLVVLKPSGDGTEKVLESYQKILNIRVVHQENGYVTDALNLGLQHAQGDIIVFLDDDAIPHKDWLRNHLSNYSDPSVGGIAGNVVPAILNNGLVCPKSGESEIISSSKTFVKSIAQVLWNCPLKGLENHVVYISRAGRVSYDTAMSQHALNHVENSLLGMGANMSVLSKTIDGFRFPNSWILGITWEQFLGWHIWKQGYKLVFNPNAIVNHIIHDQTLSRGKRSIERVTLGVVEGNLLFYRLYDREENLSKMYRIIWLVISVIDHIKKVCVHHDKERLAWIKGTFYSETIGLKWLLSRKLGGRYEPLADLKKISDIN